MPFNSFEHYPMSWKPDKRVLKRPIYRALASQLEQDIANGYLVAGTKMPPQRELADYLDINFTTVTRTYKIGMEKGLLTAVPGSGTFVSSRASQSLTIASDRLTPSCIELAFVAGFEEYNQLIPPVIEQLAKQPKLEALLGYAHPTGMPHHKSIGLQWLGNFGIRAVADQMAIASGSQNAIAIALSALFQPGDRIAVDAYTYPNFIALAKMYRLRLVPVDGDPDGMLADELDAKCTNQKIKGIFLMPSCCNPTTIKISHRRKQELAAVIDKQGLILIEDEIHAFLAVPYRDPEELPMFQLIPENTVHICGTSKPICSGLRVAYLVFPDTFSEPIKQAIFNINVKTSSLDTEVITQLILTGTAGRIMDAKLEKVKEANALFDKVFKTSQTVGQIPSLYRWLPIASKMAGEKLEELMEKQGIHVFHSSRFQCSSPGKENYLRIALSSTDSIEQLEVGLSKLEKMIGSL